MHPVEARRKAAQYRQGAPGVEVAARPAQVGERKVGTCRFTYSTFLYYM